MAPIITNNLMSTGVILVLCEQDLQSIFLLLSRNCLKRGQNQKHCDGSHLEMYLFEWLKLKSKAKLMRAEERSVEFGNVTTQGDDFTAPAKCLFSTVSGYGPVSDGMC